MEAGDKIKLTCPCGYEFLTKVRGRGASCPKCKKQTYVRRDGTTLHNVNASPATPKPKTTKGVEKVGYQKPANEQAKPQRQQRKPAGESGSVNAGNPPAIVQQPIEPIEPAKRAQRAKQQPGNTGRIDPGRGDKPQRRKLNVGGHPYEHLFGW